MRIIQKTGSVTIYQIEAQYPETAGKQYRGLWCQRSMPPERFGEVHPKHTDNWHRVAPYFTSYGANGSCWQRTGETGYLDRDVAVEAFAKVLAHKAGADEQRWRLVERVVAVTVTVIAEGNAR